MNDITISKEHLPQTVEGLNQFILIGKEKIKAHQAKIRAINAVGMAESARKAALADAQDVSTAVIYAEARLGELLKAIPRNIESSGRGTIETKPSLPDGIDKRTSHQAQTIAANPEKVERIIAEAREAEKIPTPDMVYKLIKAPHVSYNAGENEWYTPSEYIESARAVMGSIDIDPASTEIANTVVKATNIFTAESDGLNQEWHGNVWLNPPYAQPLIDKFSEKIIDEIKLGRTSQAIILVNNATETKWFQSIASVSSAICFPKGRIKFWSPDRESYPLQGQAIIYAGKNTESFSDIFNKYGFIAVIR